MNSIHSPLRQALAGLFPERYKVLAHKGMFNVVDTADNQSKLISSDELKQIDERLPSALQYLIKEHGSVHFSKVDELRELWVLDIHVKVRLDRMVAFSEIKSVELSAKSIYVKGFGILYNNVYMADIDTHVPVPIARPIGVTVERSWLDEAHPEWEKRLKIAETLNLPPTEAMRYLLAQPDVSSSAALPTEFDISS